MLQIFLIITHNVQIRALLYQHMPHDHHAQLYHRLNASVQVKQYTDQGYCIAQYDQVHEEVL